MLRSKLVAIGRRMTPVRLCVAGVSASVVAPMVFIVCMAAGVPQAMSIAVSCISVLMAVPYVARVIPPRLPKRRKSQRVLFVLWVSLSAFAALQIANLSVYMLDVERTEYASDPPIREMDDPEMVKPFFVQHNCFTCYIVAAELTRQNVENVYDSSRYSDAEQKTVVHETIGDALHIDRYQYPPPFLLLPRLLLATGHDFFQLRTYWFALNVLVFSATVAALVLWLGGYRFSVYWFLWPLVLLAPTTLSTLQTCNAHFLILCLSVAAFVCFETDRVRLGSALLGFATVSKIFPGLLLVYLLGRRRWSAVLWTCSAIAALSLLALLTLGARPFTAFFSYQLPRLASGEAFSFAFEYIRPLLDNLSVFGVAPKLEKLGWLSGVDPKLVSKFISWPYSALLMLIALALGWSHGRRLSNGVVEPNDSSTRMRLARSWLVLLVLAQLRSPFLPWFYGGTAVLWLFVLLLPSRDAWVWRTACVTVAWLVLSQNVPLWFGPPSATFDLAYTLAALSGVLAVCFALLLSELRNRSDVRSDGLS